jgi:hypothetical protein
LRVRGGISLATGRDFSMTDDRNIEC